MHALQRDYERLTAVQERWPKRYPEALQQWKLKSRIQLLSAELAINDTPERRQKLKRLIAKQIDGRIHQLESEHEKLTARLEKVQTQLDKTQQSRDQEIRRAVASAVRSAERYKNRGKKTDAGAAADVKSQKNKSQKKTRRSFRNRTSLCQRINPKMTSIARYSMLGCLCIILTMVSDGFAAPHNDRDATDSTIPSVEKRFASATDEVPDFQKHITPLLGRLGCNGRACHGSFQGQGGFQLSLFGYDFKSDHAALMSAGTGRVDLDDTTESLILVKPTDADMHDGGLRYEADSWQYNVLKQWIDGGARSAKSPARLAELKVVPNEIYVRDKKPTQLRVIAVWQDGTREDVTPVVPIQGQQHIDCERFGNWGRHASRCVRRHSCRCIL